MSSFFNFDKIKKKFPFLHDSHNSSGGGGGSFLSPFTKSGGSVNSARSKKHGHNLIVDKDPEQIWDLVGELGDGAFGKVLTIIEMKLFYIIINKVFKIFEYQLWFIRFTKRETNRAAFWQRRRL